MLDRFWNLLKFRVEQMFLRGARYRLLVMAIAIGAISVIAGTIVYRGGSDFRSPGEAYWWAFLRLTDPGYLGDDEGTLRRTVSTVVTILGYVVFLGALIAIMTQWLNRTIEKLEAGQTPVAHRGHIVILGWTNRTATIVRELMESSARLRRFLKQHKTRRLHVVVLAEEKASVLTQELRERLGNDWDERRITVRTGSPLRREHLERADFSNAAAIVIPGRDFAEDGALQSDARVIKTLLAISHFVRDENKTLPLFVAEIFDARKERLARRAYDGEIEIIASRALVARLISQCIRHPGMSEVHAGMLTRSGSGRVFVRERPEAAGALYRDVVATYQDAVVLGIVRPEGSEFRPLLHPPDSLRLNRDDRLVFLAPDRESTDPDSPLQASKARSRQSAPGPEPAPPAQSTRRVLVLGYCRKLGNLLEELGRHPGERFDVVVVSRMSPKKRASRLQKFVNADQVQVTHVEADFTLPSELATLEPQGFDVVLVVASDWWGTSEAADARSIAGCVVLADALENAKRRPKLIVELLDPDNAPLIRDQVDDVIISPLLLSYQLAQIALRRELGVVFDELFGPGGAELTMRSASLYSLGERAHFGDVQAAARSQDELAIGYRRRQAGARTELRLVPPRSEEVSLGTDTEILIIRHVSRSSVSAGDDAPPGTSQRER